MKACSAGSSRRALRWATTCLVVCSLGCVLAPVSQPLRRNEPVTAGVHQAGLVQKHVIGTSPCPELSWEAPEYKESTIDDFGEVHSIRLTGYDLLIFDEDGDVVYRRIRIPTSSHVVEQRLEGPAEYRWTVRPRYEVDGFERVGAWSRARSPERYEFGQVMRHEIPIPRSQLARFTVRG